MSGPRPNHCGDSATLSRVDILLQPHGDEEMGYKRQKLRAVSYAWHVAVALHKQLTSP